MEIKNFDRVVLTENIPDSGLEKGDIGIVVMTHQAGKGFEIQFMTLDGQTVAVETLLPHQIRPVRYGEIAHVRDVQNVNP